MSRIKRQAWIYFIVAAVLTVAGSILAKAALTEPLSSIVAVALAMCAAAVAGGRYKRKRDTPQYESDA